MKSLGPYFPLFHDDFIGGVQGFTAAEVGAYVLLLIEQWRSGSVPTSSRKLGLISRQKPSHLKPVLAKFVDDGKGGLINPRMHALRCARVAFIESQIEKGKKSAAARKSTVVEPLFQPLFQPDGQPKGNLPSPSPSPDEDSIPTPYGRVCACVPDGVKKPTIETVTAWVRAYGINLADHEALIIADLRSTPPHLWAKDGALRVKYAIANASDRHQRITRQPYTPKQSKLEEGARAAEESGI